VKNSLLLRFFVFTLLFFGVQSETFSETSGTSVPQTSAQRAKEYLTRLFSLNSSSAKTSAKTPSTQPKSLITPRGATSSLRAFQGPVLAPHESALKYLEKPQVRKLQESNRLSILSPPNEHSRSGSMEDELRRRLKPSREERLAERNRFGGSSSSAKAVDSGARASLLAGERQVPPRPARPPLPPQPKRPVRTQ
jgi:hypothetical protein